MLFEVTFKPCFLSLQKFKNRIPDSMIKIGLDTDGGDFAPGANIQAALDILNELSSQNVQIVLFGNQKQSQELIDREGGDSSLFTFVDCGDSIGMGENPVKSFVTKKSSSIVKGFVALAKGEIDSFCSTGNTGAMLVGAMQVVRTVPGIIRPCISSLLPQADGSYSIILDVGANADCKPDVLYQFAILGSLYSKAVHKTKNPRVALLNIGEEDEKGNLLTKATFNQLKDCDRINFTGNIEGSDLFSSKADVVVTDGFTGNVVLKQAEAFHLLTTQRKVKDPFFDRFNYEEYGGTPILGVNSNVLIGHGKSSAAAVKKMLKLAAQVSEANLPSKISEVFNNYE